VPALQPPQLAAADRLQVLRREIEMELQGEVLPQWAKDFCHWLSLHPSTRMPKQLEAATALAGTAVSYPELRLLKSQKAFREMWFRLRGAYEHEVNTAKEKYAKMAVKAAKIHDEMLDEVREKKDTRAAPPLVVPFLDRVWPKAAEGTTQATQVNITLSASQLAKLDEPEMEVSAEIVPAIPATT
jgi:hypothetical protein